MRDVEATIKRLAELGFVLYVEPATRGKVQFRAIAREVDDELPAVKQFEKVVKEPYEPGTWLFFGIGVAPQVEARGFNGITMVWLEGDPEDRRWIKKDGYLDMSIEGFINPLDLKPIN
jgi:hypothetical protein